MAESGYSDDFEEASMGQSAKAKGLV